MISKGLLKYVQSLQQKKFRQQYGVFLVEGGKSVLELLPADFAIQHLWATPDFYAQHHKALDMAPTPPTLVTAHDLQRAGTFRQNDTALAVAALRAPQPLAPSPNAYALMLDDVRDPGNLGTIVRVADWYGIRQLICSPTTVDIYNPKAIAASMGSFTRVHWYYTDLPTYVRSHPAIPIYGTFMDGQSVYETSFAPGGILLMGNEANGISPALAPLVGHRIAIPPYAPQGQGAESLNVALATAIVCDNLRRGRPRGRTHG